MGREQGKEAGKGGELGEMAADGDWRCPQHSQPAPLTGRVPIPILPHQHGAGDEVRGAKAPAWLPDLCCPRLPAPALTYGPHCATHNGSTSCSFTLIPASLSPQTDWVLHPLFVLGVSAPWVLPCSVSAPTAASCSLHAHIHLSVLSR